MTDGIESSLEMLFDDLKGIYEGLHMGASLLALLEKTAESPEMAEVLAFLAKYMKDLVEDVGLVARYGERQIAEDSAS